MWPLQRWASFFVLTLAMLGASPPALTKDAPLDAYFGPLKMSPLAIRSTIGFLGRQYNQRVMSDHDVLHKAVLTEDALHAWRAKYPRDSWLAPTYLHLEELYEAVQTPEARQHAAAVLRDIVRLYPNTKQAHLARLRQQQGFPPLFTESPLVASPAPDTSPSVESTAEPSGTPSPSPSPQGSPVPQ